jgi:hypothetical protein
MLGALMLAVALTALSLIFLPMDRRPADQVAQKCFRIGAITISN